MAELILRTKDNDEETPDGEGKAILSSSPSTSYASSSDRPLPERV